MRASVAILLAVLAVLGGVSRAGGPLAPRWLSDFAAAQDQAQREKRPILAVLH
jgi:hypothetical protein